MEFDKRNQYQETKAIALSLELRNLARDLPQLKAIGLVSCSHEMQAMANSVLENKRTGVPIDLTHKWRVLLEEAKVRILAVPEIANESCMGYRVEPYVYLPNWVRSCRNDL